MIETNYAAEVEELSEPLDTTPAAEKAVIGLIVIAATLCVALIAAYVVLIDGRGM